MRIWTGEAWEVLIRAAPLHLCVWNWRVSWFKGDFWSSRPDKLFLLTRRVSLKNWRDLSQSCAAALVNLTGSVILAAGG